MKLHSLTLFFALLIANGALADILFESGTLGPTGIPSSEVLNQNVPGTTVGLGGLLGVRFQAEDSVLTSQVGGHFVAQSGSGGTFLGAIVRLDNESDFPNSNDLSTADVLGVTTLNFPNPSAEVFGNLALHLDPGWYALIFGSGLFGTTGSGAAVRNGSDIGTQSYIAFDPNLHWYNLSIFQHEFDNHRFVILGEIVPEPSSISIMLAAALLSLGRASRRK